MNELHWYLYPKEKLQTGSLLKKRDRERERELITQEVLQIKKAKNCAFTKWHKQATTWHGQPCQACPFLKSLTAHSKA